MTDINRVRVVISGPAGTGPGLSTFYTEGAVSSSLPASIKGLYNALKLMFPVGVTFDIPNSGDKINVENGELAGSWGPLTGGGLVSGTGTSSWAAGVGLRLRWRTNGIVAGRRVVGSTFLVPIVTPGYDTFGTLEDTNRAAAEAAAIALVAAEPALVVWSRPVPPPEPPATKPEARDGEISPIIGAFVPDRVSWLRTRRT